MLFVVLTLGLTMCLGAPVTCPATVPRSYLPTGARLEYGQVRVSRFSLPFSTFRGAALRALTSRIRAAAAGSDGSACCVSPAGKILCATTDAPRFDAAVAQRFVGTWALGDVSLSISLETNALRLRFGEVNDLLQDINSMNAWLRRDGCVISFHPSGQDNVYVMIPTSTSCGLPNGAVGGIYSLRAPSVAPTPLTLSPRAVQPFVGTWALPNSPNRVTISSSGRIEGTFPDRGDLSASATGVDQFNLWYRAGDCRTSFTLNSGDSLYVMGGGRPNCPFDSAGGIYQRQS